METCVTEPAGTVGRKGLFPGGSSRVRAINPSRSASAESRRANPTAPADQQIRKGHTLVPMSNLIAKIRHWLHLDKKPKTS